MERLLKKLTHLHRDWGLVALKGGTEVEDMSFEEIAFLKALGEPLLPLTVKIGGPEARNDIRAMKLLGVDCILAPMVESEYALKNFVEAVLDIYGDAEVPRLAVNIETVTSFNNLDAITGSEYFRRIHQVTVGRSDLSASMGRTPDDEEVLRVTETIVRWSEEMGKKTSVGGKITSANAELVRTRVRPAMINTRHMVLDLSRCHDLAGAVRRGLEFEADLCEVLAGIEPSKREVYRARVVNTRERMNACELPRCAAG